MYEALSRADRLARLRQHLAALEGAHFSASVELRVNRAIAERSGDLPQETIREIERKMAHLAIGIQVVKEEIAATEAEDEHRGSLPAR